MGGRAEAGVEVKAADGRRQDGGRRRGGRRRGGRYKAARAAAPRPIHRARHGWGRRCGAGPRWGRGCGAAVAFLPPAPPQGEPLPPSPPPRGFPGPARSRPRFPSLSPTLTPRAVAGEPGAAVGVQQAVLRRRRGPLPDHGLRVGLLPPDLPPRRGAGTGPVGRGGGRRLSVGLRMGRRDPGPVGRGVPGAAVAAGLRIGSAQIDASPLLNGESRCWDGCGVVEAQRDGPGVLCPHSPSVPLRSLRSRRGPASYAVWQ